MYHLNFNVFNQKNSNKETILGVKINRKITFGSHIKTFCAKAGEKLCAILKI